MIRGQTYRKAYRLSMVLLLTLVVVVTVVGSCVYEPLETDLRTRNIYPITTNTYDIGSLLLQYKAGYFQNVFINGVAVVAGGGGDVSATANITDNSVVRGDGGAKSVQDSTVGANDVTINDFGDLVATGDLGGFDINAANDLNCVNDLDCTDDADIGGDVRVVGGSTLGGFIDWSGGNVTHVPLTGNIQTYVNNAVAGDTLVLASGLYTITSTITVSKQLNIVGQGNAGFATSPVTPSHGTIISCATNNVTAFQISSDNVRIAHLSINMTGDNSMAINAATNLVGVVFANIDVIVDCAGTAQAFTLNSSDAVLRDLTFYVTSSDNTASGVLAYNNGTSTQNAVVDCFNVTGIVVGGATSAYAFGCWNNNDGGHTITLNLANCIGTALAGTPLDVATVSYSVTTNNAIVNAYLCTFGGENYDAYQTGTNQLNVGGSVLVNGLVFGTLTYRATMTSGSIVVPVNVNFGGLQVFANNAAAVAGGLAVGDLYRTNGDPDLVCVVH